MPVTTRTVPNVGSPPGDPAMLLPGKLFIPDSGAHPPPWPCVVATLANDFSNNENGNFTSLNQPLTDLANAGFLCLQTTVRLMGGHPPPGQTTDGMWHQQTDDLKIAVRAMRSNPFGFGYSVTGYVAALGGSGSAHHALWMALEGTLGVDKADAAICLSPPTDYSNRESDMTSHVQGLITTYGRGTGDPGDLPTLLAESPISLDLVHASPILHYNGISESPGMPLSMWTRFKNAMIAAGNPGLAGYTAIENMGTLGTLHSFKMWSPPSITGVRDAAIAWLLSTVTPPPPPIPNPPSLLTATAISQTEIDLGWHDNSANEDGFKIEQSLDGITWSEIFVTAPNIVAYNNTGLTAGTLYYYRVRAFNAGGNSAYSNTASATTNNPPPMVLHTPTITPPGSPDSNADAVLACSDAGSHLFYTLGSDPPDPTHTGDTPTGSTFRIGSNSGTVNSGAGVNLFKVLAYEAGFTDSAIAVSDTFGTPPVTGLQPILTGIGQLLPDDQLPPNRLGDTSGFPGWQKDFVDFFRYRGCWNNLEPSEGSYFWNDLDAIFALAAANNKFISLSVAAGEFTPQWVYDSGAIKYGPIHYELPTVTYQPLPWDPKFQVKWFAFLNALATRYAGNDRLRAMIDTGFMPVFSMYFGDLTDEAALPITGTGFSYPDVHAAYRAGAQAVLTTTFSLFPNIGHAITYTKVWDNDSQFQDAQYVRDNYRSTWASIPDRVGTIVTSLRAVLPPHTAPDPNRLVPYPSYAQEFWIMTAQVIGKTYVPPEPVPFPPPLQCLQDCLEHAWSNGQQYVEVYRGDIEFVGAEATFLIERTKLKSNLFGEQPPTCPPGQHWDPSVGQCVPDIPPTCPEGQHWDPIQLKCVPDQIPLPVAFKRMLPILENAQLGSDLDFQNNFLLNPGLLLPCPAGLLEINDVRLMDARLPVDGSITNDSVALNAGIQQSKLSLTRIPNIWTGHNSYQAAAGNAAEFVSNKGVANGYVPLRTDGTFNPSFLASTGPHTGTTTFIGICILPPFTGGVSSIDHGTGFLAGGWLPAPPYSWLGITGGLPYTGKLVPSYLTEPIPVGLVPSLAASKFTTGVFNKVRLPVAVGLGVGHAAGVVPDTGDATVGSIQDYLGRDMKWHSFEDVVSPQPTAQSPNIILQSYYLGQGSIRIRSLLNGSNLFYRASPSLSTAYVKASSTDFTILVDVGDRVDAYSAKAGYNNSALTSFTVPPAPTG